MQCERRRSPDKNIQAEYEGWGTVRFRVQTEEKPGKEMEKEWCVSVLCQGSKRSNNFKREGVVDHNEYSREIKQVENRAMTMDFY